MLTVKTGLLLVEIDIEHSKPAGIWPQRGM